MRSINFLISNLLIFIFFLILFSPLKADENFDEWLTSYKKYAETQGISKETINWLDTTNETTPKIINICKTKKINFLNFQSPLIIY